MPDPVTLDAKAHDLDETGLQASADALYALIHDALGVEWFDRKDARSYAYCAVQPYLAAGSRADAEAIARNYVPEDESLSCAEATAVLTFRDRVALVDAGRYLPRFDDLDVLRALCGEAAACVDEVGNDAARELAVRLRQAWAGGDPVGESSLPRTGDGE